MVVVEEINRVDLRDRCWCSGLKRGFLCRRSPVQTPRMATFYLLDKNVNNWYLDVKPHLKITGDLFTS